MNPSHSSRRAPGRPLLASIALASLFAAAVDAQARSVHGARSPTSVEIVDPVPLDGSASLLQGTALSRSGDRLASGGRDVAGAAADGVTQLVIRVPGSQAGERFTFTIDTQGQDPQTCHLATGNDCGLVFDPTLPPDDLYDLAEMPTVTVAAFVPKGQSSALAIAAFRAPADFVRFDLPNGDDTTQFQRHVVLDVQSDLRGALAPVDLVIARPPVELVHGNWSDPAGSFGALAAPLWPPNQQPDANSVFWIGTVDYSATMIKGIAYNAGLALTQASDDIDRYRRLQGLAATQFDGIGYSMGGLVVRQLPLVQSKRGYFNAQNYARGQLHKLVAVDTPNLGSPFATNLDHTNIFCREGFRQAGDPVGQNIKDLEPGSPFLRALNQATQALHARATAVEGNATPQQAQWTQDAFGRSFIQDVCNGLLPAGGFSQLFDNAPNDLIVAEDSQLGKGLVIGGGSLVGVVMPRVVHAVDTSVFIIGPSVLGHQATDYATTLKIVDNPLQSAAATKLLVDLLDTAAGASAWQPMMP
ncbi:MAG TPA: hypothetical protein VH328_12675 [Burkholderiaceae bacterium]|nr:hypothetical protein [Burkholderiaceae bacterium]